MLALPSSNSRRARSQHPAAPSRANGALARADDIFSSPFAEGGHEMMPFGGGMFESMNRMMQEMHSLSSQMFRGMDAMMSEAGRLPVSSGSGPQFFSRTIQQSTSYDPSGRPVVQNYQTQAYGAVDRDGTRVAERKQYYSDSSTGLEKRAVERKVGDRSRKVVQERLGNEEHRSDLYRNMNEREASDFDRVWQERSSGLGFSNQHALPGPSGNVYARQVAQPRVREDEGRRGAYVPDHYKREDQPVRVRREAPVALPAPQSDLQPTVPNGLRNYAPMPARPPVQRPRAVGRGGGGTPMPGA